jgi:chromosome segregation ATPase
MPSAQIQPQQHTGPLTSQSPQQSQASQFVPAPDASLQTRLARHVLDLASSRQQLALAQQRADTAEARATRAEAELEHLERELERERKEAREARLRYSNATGMEREIQESKEMREMKEMLHAEQARNMSASRALDKLKAEKEQDRATIDELRAQLEQARSSMATAITGLENRLFVAESEARQANARAGAAEAARYEAEVMMGVQARERDKRGPVVVPALVDAMRVLARTAAAAGSRRS